MTISDSEYSAWLTSRNRKPVYLIEITGKDSEDDEVVVRASDQRYTIDDNAYRARLLEMEMLWELESGLFSEIHTDTVTIKLLNTDKKLDSWKDLRLRVVTVSRGDVSWPKSEFRTVFEGDVHSQKVTHESIELVVASKVNRINESVEEADFAFGGSGNCGTVAKSYLTDSIGGKFSLSDLDVDSFDDADENWDYLLDVDFDSGTDRYNYLELIDKAFAGTPLDLAMRKNGKLFVPELRKPVGSTDHSTFYPIDMPEIEIVPPLGEVKQTIVGPGGEDEVFKEDSVIKDEYPNSWRSLEITTEIAGVDGLDRAEDLCDQLLALFDRTFDRVRFKTTRDLSNIDLGDEIHVQFDRYGYSEGKYGIVTLMREPLSGASTVEVWV